MKPVVRQMVILVTAIAVSLAVLLVYFYTPLGVGGLRVRWPAAAGEAPAAGRAVPDLSFRDVTSDAGVYFTHAAGTVLSDIRQVMSPGFGLADLNGDGAIDLFLVNSMVPGEPRRSSNALYLNRGGMRFEAQPAAGGADSGEWGMGCAVADYDADGDQDIYVTALGSNRLYRNDGSGRFQEVAEAVGVADPRWSTGAAFADYDRDGDLDLYVSNYLQFDESLIPANVNVRYDRDEPPAFSPYVFPAAGDALLRNDQGAFIDVTESAGIRSDGGKGMAALFADLNHDRLPDLLVINDVSFNFYYHNEGHGRLSDAGTISGLADPRSGMGIALGDYDNDGAFDLFSTHWQDESNVLYRNVWGAERAGEVPLFEDVTIQVGLAAPSMGNTGWGASWADFDLDGDLDLVVVNGYTSPAAGDPGQCIGQPVMMFMNEGGTFVDRAPGSGLEAMSKWASRGAGTADLDDDGDLDLVIAVNNGPVHVFENRLPPGRWLKVRPVGSVVTGTVVRLRCGGIRQQRMIVSGSSYLCSEAPEAHFGLGGCEQIDELDVCWPDGTTQTLKSVPSNQTLVVPKT